MTNKEFAVKDQVFRKACELTIINNKPLPASARQASKYRRGLGVAFKMKTMAVKTLAEEKKKTNKKVVKPKE